MAIKADCRIIINISIMMSVVIINVITLGFHPKVLTRFISMNMIAICALVLMCTMTITLDLTLTITRVMVLFHYY